MTQVPELSIFFPFWNEEKNIENTVLKAIPVAEKIAKKWEIIMVDDGSTDRTGVVAQKLLKKDTHLRLVTNKPNKGYGGALRAGLDAARFDLIAFTDGDGQLDISELPKFLAKVDGNDMVIGYRKKRKDNLVRHLLMMVLKIWDYVFFGFHFKDIDCGFKLFTRKSLNAITPLHSNGAMITTEILAKAKKAHLKIAQVEVNHYPRAFGEQSGANLHVLFRAVRESFFLWQQLNYGKSN